MSEAAWRVDRQNLRELVGGLDGRMLVAIGVANGAEARQLHHTICELRVQEAVPLLPGDDAGTDVSGRCTVVIPEKTDRHRSEGIILRGG